MFCQHEPERVSTFNIISKEIAKRTARTVHYWIVTKDPAWCCYIDCDAPHSVILFKAIAGNAIYWENVHETALGMRGHCIKVCLPVEV